VATVDLMREHQCWVTRPTGRLGKKRSSWLQGGPNWEVLYINGKPFSRAFHWCI